MVLDELEAVEAAQESEETRAIAASRAALDLSDDLAAAAQARGIAEVIDAALRCVVDANIMPSWIAELATVDTALLRTQAVGLGAVPREELAEAYAVAYDSAAG